MANFALSWEPMPDVQAALHHRWWKSVRTHPAMARHRHANGPLSIIWATGEGAPVEELDDPTGFSLLLGEAGPPGTDPRVVTPLDTLALWRRRAAEGINESCDGYHAIVHATPDGTVRVAGDFCGVFPIYYWATPERIVVASSPAMFEPHPDFPREFDPISLGGILLTNGMIEGRPLWLHARRLQPDHLLVWRRGEQALEIPPARRTPAFAADEVARLSDDELIDLVHRESLRAVGDSLQRTSGRLVAMLSGGLDSRTVLGYSLALGQRPDMALTFGAPHDVDARCGATAARLSGVPHEVVSVENEDMRRDMESFLLHDQLAGGSSNGVWAARAGRALAQRGDRALTGLIWDTVYSYSKRLQTCGFTQYVPAQLRCGMATHDLEKLFATPIAHAMMNATHEFLESSWSDCSKIVRKPMMHLVRVMRSRFHVGNMLWTVAQHVWPVCPSFDLRVTDLIDAMPDKLLFQRALQNETLRRHFPALARAPLDVVANEPTWIVPAAERVPMDEPATRTSRRFADDRHYWRVYGFRSSPYWRRVLDDAIERGGNIAPGFLEPARVLRALEDVRPDGALPDRIALSCVAKNLLAFGQWYRERSPQIAWNQLDAYSNRPSPFASTYPDELVATLPDAAWKDGLWETRWMLISNRWRQFVHASFAGDVHEVPHVANAALPPTLLAGMTGPFVGIGTEQAVSPLLADGTKRIHDFMVKHHPTVHPVTMDIPTSLAPLHSPESRGLATFFTGGVDSSYTAWTLRKHLKGLVFVHGFDVPLGNETLFRLVRSELSRLAGDLGLDLTIVRTDLRQTTDRTALWGKVAFGGALACVAHLLAGRYHGLAIPASYDMETLMPAGSMPQIDPLWSSEDMSILHHGADKSRFEKVQALAAWPEGIRRLRVCWQNPGGAYNCGRCEKCLRTMVLLELAGLRGKAASFPTSLDVDAIANLELPSSLVTPHWLQIVRILEDDGGKSQLETAIRSMLQRNAARTN